MTRAPSVVSIPMASAAQVLAVPDARIVDLRSPSEFAEDHLPGAVNAPLFDDVARRSVGTLFHRTSPDAAFEAGLLIARERVDALVATIAEVAGWPVPERDLREPLARLTEGGLTRLETRLVGVPLERLPERAVVLHCWRGGLRSRSVVALLRGLGFERAVGLTRGYKGYRTLVRERLEAWRAPPAFVLRGLTGVGKTLVLRELERLRPSSTVDLEGLAEHRSSILGMVGLAPCSQKTFESRLAARLARGFTGAAVFEGESRKIGDVILPPRVWAALEGGTSLELTAPIERRIDVLIEDYLAHPSSRAELRTRLPFIEQRLGAKAFDGVLTGLLDAGRERELVEVLLERYYDPLYRHSERERAFAASFDATDPARAAAEVARWIEDRAGSPRHAEPPEPPGHGGGGVPA